MHAFWCDFDLWRLLLGTFPEHLDFRLNVAMQLEASRTGCIENQSRDDSSQAFKISEQNGFQCVVKTFLGLLTAYPNLTQSQCYFKINLLAPSVHMVTATPSICGLYYY